MYKVIRIVTARDSVFEVGKACSATSYPVTSIEFQMGEVTMGDMSSYGVQFSDGSEVEVKDAVEIWRVPMTPEELEAQQLKWATLP
jgi:hypothetical protein